MRLNSLTIAKKHAFADVLRLSYQTETKIPADPIRNKNGLLRIRLLRPQLLGKRCRNPNGDFPMNHERKRIRILRIGLSKLQLLSTHRWW